MCTVTNAIHTYKLSLNLIARFEKLICIRMSVKTKTLNGVCFRITFLHHKYCSQRADAFPE